jgi:hypothetical protein
MLKRRLIWLAPQLAPFQSNQAIFAAYHGMIRKAQKAFNAKPKSA